MAFVPTLGKFGVPTESGQTGNGILMPKLGYRFRVFLTNFGTPGSALDVTRQVVSCTRPKAQQQEVDIHSYNNIMYVGGKVSWQTIQLVIRDDVTNAASSYVSTQWQQQMNHFDQTQPESGINYKFTMNIQTLNGGDDVVLENWYLEGCWLTDVDWESFNYSQNEAVQISMTIRYDNAQQDSTIMPQTVQSIVPGFTAG